MAIANTKGLFPDGKETAGMVSVSQLQTFMACPKKWAYNYIENLTPRVERPYLSIGKLCHKGMETAMRTKWAHGNDKCTMEKSEILSVSIEAMRTEWNEYMGSVNFLDEEIPIQEQTLQDAISVFTQAFSEFDFDKYEVVTLRKNGERIPALELHFLMPCPGSKGLHGYIDAILYNTETGMMWCVDYKFRKTLSPDEEEMYNVQNAVYARACARMGLKITGTMTWQHVNTPPTDPAVLKSGAFSRAFIKTTWEHYAECVRAAGQDPAEYEEEMKPKLADNEWFRETLEYRNVGTIENIWWQSVVPTSWAINKARKKESHSRSLYPWNCKMCQYGSLCQAELRGHDAMFLRLAEYADRSAMKRASTPTEDTLQSAT